MAFIALIQTFLLWVTLGVFVAIGFRFIQPLRRFSGWTVLAFTIFGIFAAHRALGAWIENKYLAIKDSPRGGTDLFYFVGDYIPTYRMMGGTIRPEILAFVREQIRKEPDPCAQVWMKKGIGDPLDPTAQAVCLAKTPKQ